MSDRRLEIVNPESLGAPKGFNHGILASGGRLLFVAGPAGGGGAAHAPPQRATRPLTRPERLNALTFEVYAELRDTFRALDAEPGVRAIVLTGAGRAFCSGGDVEDIIGALFGRSPKELLEFTRMTCDLVF